MPSPSTSVPAEAPQVDAELAAHLRTTLQDSYYLGKSPLFVLGAGISANRVPFVDQMAERLVSIIRSSDKISKTVKPILTKQGESIQEHTASRSDAAEFFSTCQLTEEASGMPPVWSQFCNELALAGLTTAKGQSFTGLFRLRAEPDPPNGSEPLAGPSSAHLGIASLLTANACNVLNLNYDPLLFLAMSHLRRCGGPAAERSSSYHLISLHTDHDIRRYYSSSSRHFQPCVINARGDIFYARCTNERCPDYATDRSLDSRFAVQHDEVFRCASCHLTSIHLQLSFPGYETKERLVQPILYQLRDFLGHRVSAIVPIGLSGQWDPYLLSEIFDWSLTYLIPIIDVKPTHGSPDAPSPFDRFRRRYFPSIPNGVRRATAWYAQWASPADKFVDWLLPTVRCLDAFRNIPDPYSQGTSNQGLLPLGG